MTLTATPLKILDRLEEALIATLMAAATLVIFAAVLHRYAAGIPALYPYVRHMNFAWAQELCIYMFVWMAKFGAAYGVRTGIHVGVDVLINRLSERNRSRFIVLGLLAGALFTGVVGSLGLHFVMEMQETEQVSSDLEWPMWIIYLCVPLGSYLMCFRFLQVCVAFLRTGDLPHHDHSHVAGMEEERAEDVNWFRMDDDLHPKTTPHHDDKPQEPRS